MCLGMSRELAKEHARELAREERRMMGRKNTAPRPQNVKDVHIWFVCPDLWNEVTIQVDTTSCDLDLVDLKRLRGKLDRFIRFMEQQRRGRR